MADYSSRDIFFGNYFNSLFSFTAAPRKEWDEKKLTVDICEAITSKGIEDIHTLRLLGHLYTDLGEYASGLEVDLTLTALLPKDSNAWYNLACSYALLFRVEEAVDALETAINLGYDDIEFMTSDPDLDSIRETDEYRELISRLMHKQGFK